MFCQLQTAVWKWWASPALWLGGKGDSLCLFSKADMEVSRPATEKQTKSTLNWMEEPARFNFSANPERWMLLWSFHCFPLFKCEKLKYFLAAGMFLSYWRGYYISDGHHCHLPRDAAAAGGGSHPFLPRKDAHMWITAFCWAHPYTVPEKGLSRPSPRWDVSSEMVQKGTSSHSGEKNQTTRKQGKELAE